MDSNEDSYASDDSDKELQVALSKGLLKDGLNYSVEKRSYTNDVPGLRAALEALKSTLPWPERLDITCAPTQAPAALLDSQDAVHDDFQRELHIYHQAQAAVLLALPKLAKHKIPTQRPDDYFAEMAKSDLHMKKVREKLLSKKLGQERSDKAKKLRELRKYGKKVQHEVQQKRQKEKKELISQVNRYRKGKETRLDFLEDGPSTGRGQPNNKRKGGDVDHRPNKRREYKNKKFGFGGQKKRGKYNTSDSTKDMSDFNVGKHNTRPGKKGPAGGTGGMKKHVNKNRPGKARRQKTKANNKQRKK